MPAKENESAKEQSFKPTKEQLKAVGRRMNADNLKRHEEKVQKRADYQEKNPGWTPTPKAKTREEGLAMNEENLRRHDEKQQRLADYKAANPGWTPTPKAKTREEGLAMNADNLKRHEEKAQKLADYQEKNPTWQKPMSASELLAQEAAQLQSEGSETEAEADGPEA